MPRHNGQSSRMSSPITARHYLGRIEQDAPYSEVGIRVTSYPIVSLVDRTCAQKTSLSPGGENKRGPVWRF